MTEESKTSSRRPERILGSFASLLSSALMTGETPELLSTSSSNLPRFVATRHSEDDGDDDCCTVPCLTLKHSGSSSTAIAPISLEEAAALCLARPLTVTREELEALPLVLLENVAESFMSLVDSRLRSSLSALMKQPVGQNESAIARAFVALLAASTGTGVTKTSSPISPTAVVTSFRVMPGCDLTQSGDHVAPLIMETMIDLSIFNRLVTVTFLAPGTIQGSFEPSSIDCLLSKVEVVLDTVALLQSMMKQARSAVREAVIIASGVASNLLISPPEESDEGALRGATKTVGSAEGASSHNMEGSTYMQPPPPRVSGSSGGSTPDLPSEDARTEASTFFKNTLWDQGPTSEGTGLSLLTAAADAFDPDSKQVTC